MNDKDIIKVVNKVYPKIRDYYGSNRSDFPPIEIHTNIHARLSGEPDAEGEEEAEAEFDRKENKIFLYSDTINTDEDIIRGIIHEYVHFLQNASWMKRYYNMGRDYTNHPYEMSASKEEENWKKFA
jgi:hypothetical protein